MELNDLTKLEGKTIKEASLKKGHGSEILIIKFVDGNGLEIESASWEDSVLMLELL